MTITITNYDHISLRNLSKFEWMNEHRNRITNASDARKNFTLVKKPCTLIKYEYGDKCQFTNLESTL